MEIRPVVSLDDIERVCALFGAVWEAPLREQVPPNLLRALTAHENLLLGAFDGGEMTGAVLGMWGRDDDGTMWLYSSRLGVLPSHRGTGVAEALKRAQAAWCAPRGVREIRWTFDPMRARNAAFNLRKLRARAIAFEEDLFGPRGDRYNAGERTDRLWVSWWPDAADAAAAGETRRVGIPPSHEDYLAMQPSQRAAERDRVRDELRAAFDDGFVGIDFERPGTYVLRRIA